MALLADFIETRARKLPGASPAEGGWWAGESAAGVTVNDETALGSTGVLSALLIISSCMAALPRHVYRRTGDRSERDRNHRLASVLAHDPNPEMSGMSFWTAQLFNKLARGNQVAEIEEDNRGLPVRLWPIQSNRVEPERVYKAAAGGLTTEASQATPESRRAGGVIQFKIDGGEDVLPARAVFHVPDLVGYTGLWGRSRLAIAATSIGLGLSGQRYAASTMQSSAVPPIAIKRPADAPSLTRKGAKNRLKAWEADHGGPWRAGRTALLQEGEEIEKIGFTPQEAQLIDVAQFHILDIARIFVIPAHLLAHLLHATFSNIEHQWLQFLKVTALPHLVSAEQEAQRKLFPDGQHVMKHEVEGLLRGDAESRAKFYQSMWQIAAMTTNEIRERENLRPIPGGDRAFAPLNYAPTDQILSGELRAVGLELALRQGGADLPQVLGPQWDAANRALPAAAERRAVERRSVRTRRRIRDSYRSLIEDAVARLVRREVRAVRREMPRLELTVDEFLQWVETFYEELRGVAESYVGPALLALFEAVAGPAAEEVDADLDAVMPAVATAAAAYRAGFAGRYVGEHRTRLRQAAAGEDPLAGVEAVLTNWTDTAAAREARRESVRADSRAAQSVYRAAGRTRTRWVFHGGDCEICPPLDGLVVTIGEPYLNPGDETPAMTVRHVIHGPPAHRGCECSEVAD